MYTNNIVKIINQSCCSTYTYTWNIMWQISTEVNSMCTTHLCHTASNGWVCIRQCHRLETRSFALFNMVYINYYFGGHFDFFHDLRNSNTCNFKQLIFVWCNNIKYIKYKLVKSNKLDQSSGFMENNVHNMIQFKMAAKYPRWLPKKCQPHFLQRLWPK